MNIANELRAAIQNSGKSLNAIARESGVPQPMLTRFVSGSDMMVRTADKLAAYFGLSLRPDAPTKPAKPAKPKRKS